MASFLVLVAKKVDMSFSLCVDYFNPLGNKQAGKKKSIGLISLVCLNLPPDMRYKPEKYVFIWYHPWSK